MVRTVEPRPNHYEMLGLKPTASDEEIARAFAREASVFRPRVFGGVTQIGIAYETLRDPIKRRAYDASLGLTRKPEPRHVSTPAQGRLVGTAPSASIPQRGGVSDPLRTGPMNSQPCFEAAAERTLGSFIATSLREPAEAATGLNLRPKPAHSREVNAVPSPESPIPHLAIPREAKEPVATETETRAIEWTSVAAGGLVLGIAFLGSVAVLSGRDSKDPQVAKPEVTVTLPAATPFDKTVAPSAPPPVEALAGGPMSSDAIAARVEPTPSPPEPALAERLAAEPRSSVENRTGEGVVDDASASAAGGSSSAQVSTAPLPLPNSVIARTIERIGYACGSVASATAADAPGVYKITCTSGQSYQATPVRGRYRFRRWGSR